VTNPFRPDQQSQGPNGQIAHEQHLAHTDRLQERFYAVGEHAWCYVGNGLSNQTFVRGPGGIIAIDTGECHEEMAQAIEKLRQHTDEPIVACIYSHFHYVAGTTAIVADRGDADFPIYGHEGIKANLARFGGEVGPRGSRGMVHQFAMMLPETGNDARVNIGLGLFFRNPKHAPYTGGHIPATHTFGGHHETVIAGLKVIFHPAPSDATDSVTMHFPELDLAVNNIFWPTLFNVFAIRGEEYRDPRVLLTGLDHLASLNVEHQICAHGPPMSGRAESLVGIQRYRDSIQFIWDQTARYANLGLALDEIIHKIKLPIVFETDFHTQQLYGVVEHHVRQVYTGLFGWFDEDPGKLFPLAPAERATKMIKAFGGRHLMRAAFDEALAAKDYRWALELGQLLVSDPAAEDAQTDKARLASGLRQVAFCSPAANIRNWCLTRALELEGSIDLSRFRIHRFREQEVLSGFGARWVPILRVLLDAEAATGFYGSLGFEFDDGSTAGLLIRHSVAVPVSKNECDLQITLSVGLWAKLLAGKTTLSAVLAEQPELGDEKTAQIKALLGLFDVMSFKR
jgi:alkyl sulfatase BDS1-like metallo-beta-lactamase superfamily hydrolase